MFPILSTLTSVYKKQREL